MARRPASLSREECRGHHEERVKSRDALSGTVEPGMTKLEQASPEIGTFVKFRYKDPVSLPSSRYAAAEGILLS
jgi:hypothetical protein